MHPDKQKTTYTMLSSKSKKPPRIIFSSKALKWIEALVDIHDQEVGFYGVVDSRENYTFFVRDIFYPKHSEANAGTCEISSEGAALVAEWLIKKGREEDTLKLRFWGHSHHTMGTSPSKQDEDQSIERLMEIKTFLIRVICNKSGEISCSFFDYKNQIRFDHIKWEVEDNLDVIKSILENNDEHSPENKLEEIKSLINEEKSIKTIREKIKKLKKENIPTYNKHKYNDNKYYDNYSDWYLHGRQRDLFKKGHSGLNQQDEDDFLYKLKDDEIREEEVDKIIKKFEEGVGVIE